VELQGYEQGYHSKIILSHTNKDVQAQRLARFYYIYK